jgi:hypothetical protein
VGSKGNYSVVGFKYDSTDLEREILFLNKTNAALDESERRLLEDPEARPKAVIAEVLFIEEVDEYSSLYYLNEAAVRMCRDVGFPLEILKTISKGEIPANPGIQWRRPYLPKSA